MKNIKITDIDFNLGFFQDAEGWYVDESGSEYHFKNGYLHSMDDLPAVEFFNGGKEWYRNGELHRLKGPAIFKSENSYEWYKNGVRHREDDDGPAYGY